MTIEAGGQIPCCSKAAGLPPVNRSRSPSAKVVSEVAKPVSALQRDMEGEKTREELRDMEEEKTREDFVKRVDAMTDAQEAREKEAKEAHEEALRMVAVARAEREAERLRLLEALRRAVQAFMEDVSDADEVFREASNNAIRHFQRAANAAQTGRNELREMQELQRLYEEFLTIAREL